MEHPTDEGREAGEDAPLLGAEQVGAPTECVAECLLARRSIARPDAEHRHPIRETSSSSSASGRSSGQRPARAPGAGNRGVDRSPRSSAALPASAGFVDPGRGSGASLSPGHRTARPRRPAAGARAGTRAHPRGGEPADSSPPRSSSSSLRPDRPGRGAASMRCSKLSSTSNMSRFCAQPPRAAAGVSCGVSGTLSARAIVPMTSFGSCTGASSMNAAPLAKSGPADRASCRATRVLPLPPAPLIVTRRTSSRATRCARLGQLGLSAHHAGARRR